VLRNHDRRDVSLHDVPRCLGQLPDRQRWVETDRKRVALLAVAEHVREHAGAIFGVADVLKQKSRRALVAGHHIGEGGGLFVRVDRRIDGLDLALRGGELDPLAQVAPLYAPAIVPLLLRAAGRSIQLIHGSVLTALWCGLALANRSSL